nr:MAG TPA: hypothetical protein [Caudoviricetes sp.]
MTRTFVYSRYNAESGLINKKTPTGNVLHTFKCNGSIDVGILCILDSHQ